jgi:imidazolonepropionase
MFDRVYTGFDAATMRGGRYGEIKDAALAVRDGRIAWIGSRTTLPASAAAVVDLSCGWITPGLIDCHTHLVFGGDRSSEFEQRLGGTSYEAIAASGGGILSTVRATRAASEAELFATGARRLRELMADGVTTVEIKSGYGLDLASELKMLRVARRLGNDLPVTVCTTCLAAHSLPDEFAGRPDDYIDFVCREILPAAASAGLVDSVDAFCERTAFSPGQVARVFETAKAIGLPVKLHAEQRSRSGGASLAARYGAQSADHLEYATEADVVALAAAGIVAVLLPGAFYLLREPCQPPVELLRRHEVPMAIASDANPGTSPALSLRLMLNMACTLFRLTPEEALAGVTTHAARALGMEASHGTLELGKTADFVHWNIERPAELAYWLGGRLPTRVFRAGLEVAG